MKILITGQEGFIGYHLYNTIKFSLPDIEIINFEKKLFQTQNDLDKTLSRVDIIIHLAGVNRAQNESYVLKKNLIITDKLINSLSRINFSGKLIFASSTQHSDNNPYGNSKKLSTEKFFKASKNNNFTFINLIIPNVFGPFCKPNYNSFIATFCHNEINGIPNNVEGNNQVSLIYIDNLVDIIIEKFQTDISTDFLIKEDIKIKVEDVKKIIEDYNKKYFLDGNIPNLDSNFKMNLFTTFHSYINSEKHFPKNHNLISDTRGSFSEVIRFESSGQVSYSLTKPKKTRGNHFHTRKIERFTVIQGEALIRTRKIGSNKINTYKLNGKNPSYVDMKVWYTHSIENIGSSTLISMFWINEFYNENDSDTFFEKV